MFQVQLLFYTIYHIINIVRLCEIIKDKKIKKLSDVVTLWQIQGLYIYRDDFNYKNFYEIVNRLIVILKKISLAR